MPELPPEEAEKLAVWLQAHREDIPLCVRTALEQHSILVAALRATETRLKSTLMQFRLALGIQPRSERSHSGRPIGPEGHQRGSKPKTEYERLLASKERSSHLAGWHRGLSERHANNAEKADEKLQSMSPEDKKRPAKGTGPIVEDDGLDIEERAQLGGGPDPAFEPLDEVLMPSGGTIVEEEAIYLEAPEPKIEGYEVTETIVDERVRYDVELKVRRITAHVEKKVVKNREGDRSVLSASTHSLGPPRFAATWGMVATSTLLVAKYAMPMNRLARLLSNDEKEFRSGHIWRLFEYSGKRLLPVYLHLWRQMAGADYIAGDDTSARVLEVNRHFKQKEKTEAPWSTYATREAAHAALSERYSLEAALASALGFEFPRKSGKGSKISLNTTVLCARSNPLDPRSSITFYRSHLGSMGNLLETLLSQRPPGASSRIIIQSDLSSTNLVTDPKLVELYEFLYAGCASHARRPFAQYRHEDPEFCGHMLQLFRGLFVEEELLDIHGRNSENVLAVRQVDGRMVWGFILEMVGKLSQLWSKETKLGEACRYIERNFDKLTLYLDHPHVALTNNHRERMLREEKLIAANSMFRKCLRGRFVLDINRTLLQTAIAAKVPLREYLMWVLMSDPEEVSAHPECFTPLAFRSILSEGLPAFDTL